MNASSNLNSRGKGLRKKGALISAACLALLIAGAVLFYRGSMAKGVMTLHFDGVVTNQVGVPRYTFILTNSAYDCVVERIVWLHENDKKLGPFDYALRTEKVVRCGEAGVFDFDYEGIERWSVSQRTDKWQAELHCRRTDVSSLLKGLIKLNEALSRIIGFPQVLDVERSRSIRSEMIAFPKGSFKNDGLEPVN